jgi:hypothetical protein
MERGVLAVGWVESQEAYHQQMTPKLTNKASLAKSIQYMRLERHCDNEPYDMAIWTLKRSN